MSLLLRTKFSEQSSFFQSYNYLMKKLINIFNTNLRAYQLCFKHILVFTKLTIDKLFVQLCFKRHSLYTARSIIPQFHHVKDIP